MPRAYNRPAKFKGRMPTRSPYRYQSARKKYTPRRYAKRQTRVARTITGPNPAFDAERIAAHLENRISPCVAKFLASLEDPFNGPVDACNPFTPPIYSSRLRNYGYATLSGPSNSSAGAGATICGVCGFSPSNGYALARVTGTSGWTDTTAFATSCTTSIVSSISPYAVSDFTTATNSWAPVSYGVRIMYNGTADTFGGWIAFYESPSHANLFDANHHQGQILDTQEIRRQALKPGWNSMTWSGPRTSSETKYSNTLTTAEAPYCLCFVIALPLPGDNASLGTYTIELFANMEITGDLVPGKQFSESDPEGAGRAQQKLIGAGGGRGANPVHHGKLKANGAVDSIASWVWDNKAGAYRAVQKTVGFGRTALGAYGVYRSYRRYRYGY